MPTETLCTTRGCHQPAVWALYWTNPMLHHVDHHKTWFACRDHVKSLSEFLTVERDFSLTVEPLPVPGLAPDAQ